MQDGNTKYALAGYTTVYEYYAYPANKRPRISQMLVLPSFQRMGVGTKTLNIITEFYLSRSDIVDITVEDPSDDFIRLRDFTDALNCTALDAFGKENLKKGFSEEMTKEANKKFKLCKKQV